jgi:UDP-2,3-diacylglucosamine hydrolase
MEIIEIKENAIFIADSHYCKKREKFLDFISFLISEPPPQLFLMGDIFELLFGNITVSVENKLNILLINKIKELSQITKIFYFEGNHDFNLKEIFEDSPNIVIFNIFEQPQIFDFNKQKVYLAHGDNLQEGFYFYYRRIITNKFVLEFLDAINFKNRIFSRIEKSKARKTLDEICHEIPNFKKKIAKKFSFKNNFDAVIEGHYHQNKHFVLKSIKYYNLPSFVCEGFYSVVKSDSKNHISLKNIYF